MRAKRREKQHLILPVTCAAYLTCCCRCICMRRRIGRDHRMNSVATLHCWYSNNGVVFMHSSLSVAGKHTFSHSSSVVWHLGNGERTYPDRYGSDLEQIGKYSQECLLMKCPTWIQENASGLRDPKRGIFNLREFILWHYQQKVFERTL